MGKRGSVIKTYESCWRLWGIDSVQGFVQPTVALQEAQVASCEIRSRSRNKYFVQKHVRPRALSSAILLSNCLLANLAQHGG